MNRATLFFLLALFLHSCSPPHLIHAPVEMECEWLSQETISDEALDTKWWESFQDHTLSHLIETAHCQNYTLQAAYEKVMQACYLRREISSRYYPQIDAAFDYTSSLSQFALGNAFFDDGSPGGNTLFFANGARQQVLLGGFDALWEIDLFNHTYYEVLQACRNQGALIAAYRGIQVFLAAEVARYYFSIRYLQAKEGLLKQKVHNLERLLSYEVTLKEKEITSDFPRLAADEQLESAKQLLFATASALQEAKYTLMALLGEMPATILDDPLDAYPENPRQIAVGIPAELLRRRPDIQEAEMNIYEASAEVDSAVADFFPRITLTGNYKGELTTFNSIVAAGPAWAYGIHLTSPVFQGGKLQAKLAEKKSYFREHVFAYYDTVLQAIQETESAISTYTQGMRTEESARQVYSSSTLQYDKSLRLKMAGITDEITLLQQDNQQIEANLLWLEARYTQTLNILAIYKALGGGWQ